MSTPTPTASTDSLMALPRHTPTTLLSPNDFPGANTSHSQDPPPQQQQPAGGAGERDQQRSDQVLLLEHRSSKRVLFLVVWTGATVLFAAGGLAILIVGLQRGNTILAVVFGGGLLAAVFLLASIFMFRWCTNDSHHVHVYTNLARIDEGGGETSAPRFMHRVSTTTTLDKMDGTVATVATSDSGGGQQGVDPPAAPQRVGVLSSAALALQPQQMKSTDKVMAFFEQQQEVALL